MNDLEILGSMSKADFGRWLENEMKRRNISQTQLGAAIGVSQGAVSYWLRGERRISKEVLEQVIVFLKITKPSESIELKPIIDNENEITRYFAELNEQQLIDYIQKARIELQRKLSTKTNPYEHFPKSINIKGIKANLLSLITSSRRLIQIPRFVDKIIREICSQEVIGTEDLVKLSRYLCKIAYWENNKPRCDLPIATYETDLDSLLVDISIPLLNARQREVVFAIKTLTDHDPDFSQELINERIELIQEQITLTEWRDFRLGIKTDIGLADAIKIRFVANDVHKNVLDEHEFEGVIVNKSARQLAIA